jgi:hypothetical protein
MTAREEELRRALVAVRMRIPQDEWDSYAETIVGDRRPNEASLQTQAPQQGLGHLLESLRSSAFANLPWKLEGAGDIATYLKQFPVYKGPHPHTFPDSVPLPIERASAEFPILSYRWEQLLRAPGLIDQLNDPRLLHLIEAYLGCVPTLYGLNAFWSFPAKHPELYYSQFFHRDTDDWRFLALFVYLTDVDDAAGPHQVIPGSHTREGMERLAGPRSWHHRNREKRAFASASFVNSLGKEFAKKAEHYFGDKAVNVTGTAGSMFLVNTLALHRGLMPVSKPRLVVWARYGLHPPASIPSPVGSPDRKRLGDDDTPVPTNMLGTARDRYINRLIFDFDKTERC